jgi:hypothetical protein
VKLASFDYPFVLLTPCFCGGADNRGPAEMRVASIRGQVRFWHRQIADAAAVNRIWGATEGQNVGSSKVSLTLDRQFKSGVADKDQQPILPHKGGGGGRRPAIPAGEAFALTLRRLPGCADLDWTAAQRAVKLWLLLGGLGLRCNRAAGAVWPSGDWVPKTETELANALRQLGCRWAVTLVDAAPGGDATALRRAASDTVENLGVFGSIRPRTPSPTKMKVVRLGGQCRLLLTARKTDTLKQAEQLLKTKPLGRTPWKPVVIP